MKLQNIQGQPSWSIRSDAVEASITRQGGHLAPVTFHLGGRAVRPFHVAPWAEEKLGAEFPKILRSLRGDFFCMPFGGNAAAWKGEQHPPHGETANENWGDAILRREKDGQTLEATMETSIRPATVRKTIRVRDGQAAVYCRHEVSGASGVMSFGHHATLKFPASGGIISTGPIAFGQVYPGQFENPAQGGYSCLKAGAEFRSLSRVPLAAGGWADLTRYPAREGFEDLVMVSAKPGTEFGWTAAVFPEEGYLWYSLKDPRVLASTVLWHSNGGRHYAPWNGRHRAVIGLEEVTSHFHDGLAESAAKNSVQARGIATALKLNPRKPLAVNVIMGVAAIPKGFGGVQRIERKPGGVIFHEQSGSGVVETPLDWEFLYER